MALGFHKEAARKILVDNVSGMLSNADYERFVPETERLIKLCEKFASCL